MTKKNLVKCCAGVARACFGARAPFFSPKSRVLSVWCLVPELWPVTNMFLLVHCFCCHLVSLQVLSGLWGKAIHIFQNWNFRVSGWRDYALYFSAEKAVRNNLLMRFVLSKHSGVKKQPDLQSLIKHFFIKNTEHERKKWSLPIWLK